MKVFPSAFQPVVLTLSGTGCSGNMGSCTLHTRDRSLLVKINFTNNFFLNNGSEFKCDLQESNDNGLPYLMFTGINYTSSGATQLKDILAGDLGNSEYRLSIPILYPITMIEFLTKFIEGGNFHTKVIGFTICEDADDECCNNNVRK